MKYKVGDKVKIVSLQSVGRGCCLDVVGDVGEIIEYDSSDILKYQVKIENGGSWWWEEPNYLLSRNYRTEIYMSQVAKSNESLCDWLGSYRT